MHQNESHFIDNNLFVVADGRISAFVVEHADVAIKNAHKIEKELPSKKHPKGQDIYLSIVYGE